MKLNLNLAFLVLVTLLILSFFIVKPILTPVFLALVIAYMLYPLYKRIYKKTRRKNLSAITVSLAVVLVLSVPSLYLANELGREIISGYDRASAGFAANENCSELEIGCQLISLIDIDDPEIRNAVQTSIDRVSSAMINWLSGAIFSLGTVFFNIFLMFFFMYFMLRDGKDVMRYLRTHMPLKTVHQQKIVDRFHDITYALIYGTIITAAIQGFLIAGIFFALGIASPVFWGVLAAIISLLPIIGPPVIYIPAGVLLLLQGNIVKGIILLAFGFVVISNIDSFVKPKFLSDRANLNPAVALVGFVGGVAAFGLVGLILGPIVLSLTISFVDLAFKEKLR